MPVKFLNHATGAIIMLCPVAGSKVCVRYSAAGIGGVDELTIAGIDTYMGDTTAVCIGKENDIANLQTALVHEFTLLVLIRRGAVGGEAQTHKDIIG